MSGALALRPDPKSREDGGQSQGLRGERVRKLLLGLNARVSNLRRKRQPVLAHWQELARFILPRRYAWLVTEGKQEGAALNHSIINSTATHAARNCAAGIMSGVSSPSRPWFRLTVPDEALQDDPDVRVWCEEVTKRMMRVMAGSNYYTAKATQYLDLVVFGTAPMLIYEDSDKVIRCFNPAAGEYMAATGPDFRVNTLVRQLNMTIDQVINEFGIENVSDRVKQLYDNGEYSGKGSMDNDILVCQIIEPNQEYDPNPSSVGALGLPRTFRYREMWWEASETDRMLRVSGYKDCPFSCPRWDTEGNDAYGRSPGMDVLPDSKQLQQEERRKAEAIDKTVNPPMIADIAMKNEPASLLPGAVTYVGSIQGGVGFKPAYQVNLPLAELKEDIRGVEDRIREGLFNGVFLMISQLDTVRSATEIDARREEKLLMLGPVLDRNTQEGLTPDIDRVFQIMARRGLLPPPPEVMGDSPVKVDYISPLADLQRASSLTGIEKLYGFVGSVSGARPEALDNLNVDESIYMYAEHLRVSIKNLMPPKQRDAIRAARSEQQQAQQQMQAGMEAVNAGKVLSDTQVGGGQNALSMILNGA